MFQSLKMLPAKIWFVDGELVGIAASGLAAVAWIAIPFLDYRAGFGRITRFFTGLGVFGIGFIVVMTWLALK
jgi:hypothetical protein